MRLSLRLALALPLLSGIAFAQSGVGGGAQSGVGGGVPSPGATLKPGNLNGIVFASQFTGADCGAKINAADVVLGTKGGQIWVDHTCGTTISTAITLHNTLIFIDAATYTFTTTTTGISIGTGGISVEGLLQFNSVTSSPGTELLWNGSSGVDFVSILGTSGARLDKIIFRNILIDGNDLARYTLRMEKADVASFYDVRLQGGVTSDFLGVDTTGLHWYNVGLTNCYGYCGIWSWGTGGFGWFGGQATGQVNSSNPYIYLEGSINNWSADSIEMDNNQTTFAGDVQIAGYDTNSAIASVPAGHPGAPSDVYFNKDSFIYLGGGTASQGADILVSGTATHQSQDVRFVMNTCLGLSIGALCWKFDQAQDSGVIASVSSGHTTASINTTANATRISSLLLASSDTARTSGSGVIDMYTSNSFTMNFSNNNFAGVGSITSGSNIQGFWHLANQGAVCTNGELALSTNWQVTGSATATGVAGNGQTCSWTITTGTTTGANPTITDTLTNPLPAATTRCWMFLEYGPASTHTAAAGEGFAETTLSATAPIFTFNGTPTAAGKTYLVVRTCGP